jgi:hypothetical protein
MTVMDIGEKTGEGFPAFSPPEQHLDALDAREAEFVRKIDAAALEASRHYPGLPVTAMFDVEYTIGEPDFDNGTDVAARQGFKPAIEKLESRFGPAFDLGICTTRAQETLAAELRSPTYLAGVTNRIRNTHFLIGSTSRMEETDPELYYLRHHASPAEIVETLKGVLDPAVAKATLKGHIDPSIWYDPKLVLLQRKAREYPDRVIILIDDLLAADAIKPDRTDPAHPKIMGVCVNEHTSLRRELSAISPARCQELGNNALAFI